MTVRCEQLHATIDRLTRALAATIPSQRHDPDTCHWCGHPATGTADAGIRLPHCGSFEHGTIGTYEPVNSPAENHPGGHCRS